MAAGDVVRLLYKEISGADIKKFAAKANKNSKKGGGARDLRFPGMGQLAPFLAKMFVGNNPINRRRNGKPTIVNQLAGEFHWLDENGHEQLKTAYIEPPTTARKDEWRLTRVDTFPCFRKDQVFEEDGNKLFLLIVENKKGELWPHFAREKDLVNNVWHPTISEPITNCMNAKRRKGVSIVGFVDYSDPKVCCNGK